MKRQIVRLLLTVLDRLLQNPDGREILRRATTHVPPGLSPTPPDPGFDALPYGDLSAGSQAAPKAVFVTARFRTGSTLLWQLFRELPDVVAFYEPLNERRWFLDAGAAQGTDPTHRGVTDYWREYAGLGHLDSLYDERWTDRDLYMDARSQDDAMRRYIEALINKANQPDGHTAVLQFNRMDFRLEWLRQAFPGVPLIHLVRHPREQWVSTLHGDFSFPTNGSLADFVEHDKFYLIRWLRDLSWRFPVLGQLDGRHPYVAFYVLWRLSHAYGCTYATMSTSYEDLLSAPDAKFAEILEASGLPAAPPTFASERVDGAASSNAAKYAPEDWYLEHEQDAERIVATILAPAR